MIDQTENDKFKADFLSIAASTHAYNKINNLLLMQILAKLEGRDLEEIRDNVDKYLNQFSAEFIKANS
ncbi:MAG: hypothetical protein M3O71_14295 [Bacteroidota bacterium]|nr:hypothetical protein [Bacteroidota bacterium]